MEGARFFDVLRIERVKHLWQWHRRIVNMCDIIVHYVYTCGVSAAAAHQTSALTVATDMRKPDEFSSIEWARLF